MWINRSTPAGRQDKSSLKIALPMERPQSALDLAGPADFPDISTQQTFFEIVKTLASYISNLIVVPYTFEDLRIGQGHVLLGPITDHLGTNCQQPEIVAALLALRWHYNLDPDDRGIMQTRGWACEIIAWRYLSYLSEYDLLDYLLYEVKPRKSYSRPRASTWFRSSSQNRADDNSETSSLLPRGQSPNPPSDDEDDDENDPTARFAGLNALEIAAVAEAKKFLAQRSVQRIVGAIWRGDIIFWPALNVATTKKPQRYNPRRADPYSRLRVPRYQKLFEALFFASFLALYYAVLLERHPERITPLEVLLYIWIAAFAYDEFGELRDSGSLFYTADVWNLWDACIVLVALVFLILRIIGLVQNNAMLLDISFDVLSLEALFLVPRLCSILSVHPYFGTLIPCLKEMTKDFVKFLAVVIILYLGFLTTFAMLARDTFTVRYISWILVYVFFGSSYMGFDIATKISPMLGPPLMMVFVALTNILLLTSLISLLSNSLTKIMDHAREEYLFQYSLFVLEASASRRLTYYLPPLNLIPLILFRPLKPFMRAETLRQLRITTLKATHWPFVILIWIYESAPAPKRWITIIFGKDPSSDHDEGITNNIFTPPRHVNSVSQSNIPSTSQATTRNEPRPRRTSKDWQLDLQPRQSHGRNFSYAQTLLQTADGSHGSGTGFGNGKSSTASGANTVNIGAAGSVRDLRKQSQFHATLQRHDTADRERITADVLQRQMIAAQAAKTGTVTVSGGDDDSESNTGPGIGTETSRQAEYATSASKEDIVDLKIQLSNLQDLVKRLLDERHGNGNSIGAGNTAINADEDEG